ncbi:uncharacterized protein plekhn1 isoform X2 [Narcine bancroftii]|uniref:uncharacterized protein plekhn1 isoform X2 n=1 Tax=Narcine bancroftii TaxID=1343680 RepID=UPI00383149B5
MGNKHSCIPKRWKQSKKRRKRLRENRDKIQEQIYGKLQNGLESNQHQDYYSLQAETCLAKMAEQNGQCDMETALLYRPIKEWDQSGMKLEDLGKIIHCSKVKINRHPCKEIYDRCLVLFHNHLLILSDDSHGFTYQGILPLAGISLQEVDMLSDNSVQSNAFQITGPLLHPFTVHCSSKEEVKEWLHYLDRQREENSKMLGTSWAPTSRKTNCNSMGQGLQNVDLKTLVLSQPIHGGERTCLSSLGNIIWISEAKLQHLPSQEKHDRLLVLFPTTLLILSQEDHALQYKGELPLNVITISEKDASNNNSGSLLIKGQMINEIVVSCPTKTVHQSLIYHLNSAGVTVHKYSLIETECDDKHTLQSRDQFVDTSTTLLWTEGGKSTPEKVYGNFTFPQKPMEMLSASENLPALFAHKHTSSPLPACGSSVRLAGRKLHSLSQPSPLSSTTYDNLVMMRNRLSFGYAEPFAALKREPALPHKRLVISQNPLIKLEQSNKMTSGVNISRSFPPSLQPSTTTVTHRSSNSECLSNRLSPMYTEPYTPLKLQPAPPARPLWLREPSARHSSSHLTAGGGDRKVSLRKPLVLSQLPGFYSCSFRQDHCSLTSGHQDVPFSPLYAEPFTAIKNEPGPSAVRLSAPDPNFRQKSSLDMDRWSHMQSSTEGRSCLASESSSCAYMDGNPSNNPLSPVYTEPYNSFKYQPASPTDCFWIREEVSRNRSSDYPVHCSKDDTSEYFAIMEVLDSYREEKEVSWYSDDSKFSFTSSEPAYAELESPHTDTDDELWDFKQQIIPHLSPTTLRKLKQRGMVDSRLQTMLYRWS